MNLVCLQNPKRNFLFGNVHAALDSQVGGTHEKLTEKDNNVSAEFMFPNSANSFAPLLMFWCAYFSRAVMRRKAARRMMRF